MTLEAAFIKLDEKLEHLEQTLNNVLWAVVQGQPEADSGHALLDRYETITQDTIGFVQEARAAIKVGRKAGRGQFNLAETHQALAVCHRQTNQVSRHLIGELLAFEWVDALSELATERKGAWATWAHGVKDALNRCPYPFYDVSEGLLDCWRETTEQAQATIAKAQAFNTGPQIYLTRPDDATDESKQEVNHGRYASI